MENTKPRLLEAAFTGNSDMLLNILQELYQQKLSGNIIENDILEYIKYSTNHLNSEIATISSNFFTNDEKEADYIEPNNNKHHEVILESVNKQTISNHNDIDMPLIAKYCDITLESVNKSCNEKVSNRFEITQTLKDVVQFVRSQKLVTNIAFFKAKDQDTSFNKFDISLHEVCKTLNPHNYNTNNGAMSLSFKVFDKKYVEWERNNIFENLLLRYNLGLITKDNNIKSDFKLYTTTYDGMFVSKCEALSQRTILENFELRECVNELRDENFHLNNEIYELSDKLNRQTIQIKKLSKHLPNIVPQTGDLASHQTLSNQIDEKIKNEWIMNNSNDQYITHSHSIAHDDELINTLISRYDVGIGNGERTNDEIEDIDLMIKQKGLVQRVIGENHELREMVNELYYRNYLLREIIYEQQDRINYFVLLINKLEKGREINVDDRALQIKKINFQSPEHYNLKRGIDWKIWKNLSIQFIDGYIRQIIEREYKMTIPKEINPLIANYVVNILCILLS